jgi:type IV secretion system protein VirB9
MNSMSLKGFSRFVACGWTIAFGLMPVVASAVPSSSPHSVHPDHHTLTRTPSNVVCQPLFVCDIVLDPGETILAMATGDSMRWILNTVMIGQDADTPHVLIKPTAYGLRTNLIIATDRRVCYVILVSVRHDYQYHARFYYPIADVAHITRSASDDGDGPPVDVEHVDTAYRISGDRHIAPLRVLNDGSHTYIQMPKSPTALPVVYTVAPDGSDAITNYRFRHSMFVVDGVPNQLVLVLGSGHGQKRCTIEREIQQ